MKRKKLERQKQDSAMKIEHNRRTHFESLPEVVLNPSKVHAGEYWWKCPNDEGTFTYSKEINAMWGHPENVTFCAVCCNYFRFRIKEESA